MLNVKRVSSEEVTPSGKEEGATVEEGLTQPPRYPSAQDAVPPALALA